MVGNIALCRPDGLVVLGADGVDGEETAKGLKVLSRELWEACGLA